MCYTSSAWGERAERERKKREMRGDMSEGDRKREIKEGKYARENVQQHLSFKTVTDTVSIDLYYNSSKL